MRAVLPIISGEADLLVLLEGPQNCIPRDASIWIDGTVSQIDFVAEIPERVTGIIARHRGIEEISRQSFGDEQSPPYKEGQQNLGYHAQMCGEKGGHVDLTCPLTAVSQLVPVGASNLGQICLWF